MAQVSLPYTLTAGTPENVNNLVANLNALVAGVNTVDTAQLAAGSVTAAKIAAGAVAFDVQTASSGNTKDGTANGSLIYTDASLTLGAGTWLIDAALGCVQIGGNSDGSVCGIYNRTTSAEVSSSRGVMVEVALGSGNVELRSRLVSVTLTGSTQFCPIGDRNGVSQLRAQTNASGVAGVITAIKLTP